jgi:hypothetical protein
MTSIERHPWMLIAAVILIGLAGALAGCVTKPEPRIVTREVQIPIAVKCGVDPGPDPQWVDTAAALKAAADVFERVKLLLAGRDQRDGRLAEVKAANAGCH